METTTEIEKTEKINIRHQHSFIIHSLDAATHHCIPSHSIHLHTSISIYYHYIIHLAFSIMLDQLDKCIVVVTFVHFFADGHACRPCMSRTAHRRM